MIKGGSIGIFLIVPIFIFLTSIMAFVQFIDVPSGYWAENYIIAIYNAGITTGCVQDNPTTPQNERQYCPENSVTRTQDGSLYIKSIFSIRTYPPPVPVNS